MLTLAEYKRGQMMSAGVSPEYIEAVMLQDDIRALRDTLSKKEKRFAAVLAGLTGTEDEVYAVSDLKPIRSVDTAYLKEHYPAEYAACVGMTASDIGKAMLEAYPRDMVNRLIQDEAPDMWEAKARVTVGDLEKYMGKKEAKKLEGTAIHTEMRITGKSRLVLRHPRKYPELAEPEEDEEE
ncbi:hypothetical protein J6B78_01775 [Methanocorpusculum sp.]|nr:hypothetical protein [Methanocorpusculum sp.]MBO5368607.1 hypothetical protein [Methanocorpusculum sp.]MBO5430668.1 hypothetical protein [Methanocorpusculum sp.]MBP3443112.1 hypothetical protein [Methanocorpusculaceae archaeon]